MDQSALRHQASQHMSATLRLRSIIGGAAGNLVEWYDWYAYSSLSLVFAGTFFPTGDLTAQLLGTAAVFAAGFLMRPIGAYIMGQYADTHGRKAGMGLSVALMCAGSLMIALVPGYQTIGLGAPAILLVARMIQGLSVGGEYGASATYMAEIAAHDRRGFWSSFQYVTLIGGQLAALAVMLMLQALLSQSEMAAWGWRLGFALGAVLAFAVYVLRRGLVETPSFEKLTTERPKSGLMPLLKTHPRAFLLVVVISAGGSLSFYTYTTYLQKFLVNTSGFDVQTATLIMTAALIVYMLVQPLFGLLADRFGQRPMLLLFGIGCMIVSVPVFQALAVTTNPYVALSIILIPLMLLSAYTSISALVKAEMFPAHIRALGVALPYAIGNAAFGGTAEYAALWFKQLGMEAGFYWYLVTMLGLSTCAFLMLPKVKTTSFDLEEPDVA